MLTAKKPSRTREKGSLWGFHAIETTIQPPQNARGGSQSADKKSVPQTKNVMVSKGSPMSSR